MDNQSLTTSLIARYILGELSEDERQEIEEAFFEDPAFLAQVRSVRDDLADAYVRGELTDLDRRRFEARLDENPSLRARVEFARTLAAAVDEK